MPLLENIRPSIRELPREEAMQLILKVRQSRHVVKREVPAARKAATPRAQKEKNPLAGLSQAQMAELLQLLGGGENV